MIGSWENAEKKIMPNPLPLTFSDYVFVICCVTYLHLLSLLPQLLLLSDGRLGVWTSGRKIPVFAQRKPLSILNRLFSLAVIKFVSEVLDLSLIQWFPARRFLLLASILWFDRTSVRYWKKALLQSTTEIWFATSQSACWYDVLTDWTEVYTTVAFFPEKWPKSFALLLYLFSG